MSIVNIADTPPAHKPVPVFGSAIELAHGLIREWIDENKPQLTLIFTDGCFGFYNQDTQRDVIWLIHNNPQFDASFGKVIHYDI